MKRTICILGLLLVIALLSVGVFKRDASRSETELETEEILNIEENIDWISQLEIAQCENQILVVSTDGTNADVSLHTKNVDGVWEEVLTTKAKIGKNGIGKTKEGDGKTPTGIYHFTFGFGIKENPGLSYEYVQVDDSYYWVDDSNSEYYNQFVSINEVSKDWKSAEHILAEGESYHYVLATDYNIECVPGAGSAIFMHCFPTGGAGCIAVSEDAMIEIMQKIQNGCVIIIDEAAKICTY